MPPSDPLIRSRKLLVHHARRLRTAGLADDSRRHAGNGRVVRDRLEHDGAGGNARAMTNLDGADDLGAGAEHDTTPDLRVAVAMILAGTAQCHVMQNGDVILDHCGLANHEPGGVIEENAASNRCRWMDVGLEHSGGAALQIVSEISAVLVPEPVREPVRLNGVEALEIEHRLQKAIGRGIAIESRHDVGAECEADRWIAFERVAIGLPDQLCRDVGMVEPLGYAMDHSSFERVMMQDG